MIVAVIELIRTRARTRAVSAALIRQRSLRNRGVTIIGA